MVTTSPSDSAVPTAPRKRTSSSLTYTLTNRCSPPESSIRPDRSPGCRASRSANRSASVAPLPSTCFSPPVYLRRIVGMRTETDMAQSLVGNVLAQPRERARPGFGGRGGDVARRALVVEERVPGALDDVEPGRYGRQRGRRTQRVDLVERDALVLGAVQAEPRRPQARRHLDQRRHARPAALGDAAAVERHGRAERAHRADEA